MKHGIFVTTPEVSNEYATIEITTAMSGNFTDRQAFSIVYTILDSKVLEVTKQKPYNFNFYGPGTALVQKLKVKNPILWFVDRPHLYTLRTQLLKNGKVVDAGR